MFISEQGKKFIMSWEQLRLKKYKDAAGLWTIGYGHLITQGESFPMPITQEQADNILRMDLIPAQRTVNILVDTPLPQHGFDALVSLVFNIGGANFKNSRLLRLINQGYMGRAADEFRKWRKAGGKVLAGLEKRRAQEREIFVNGNYQYTH